MSAPIPFPARDEMLVGQPAKIHSWFPTVLFTCKCDPGNEPLLLVGLGAVATCPQCGRGFAIGELAHDGRTGDGRVSLALATVTA